MNKNQLKELIIKPTLIKLKMFSPEAVSLMLGTCAQESLMCKYIKQIGGGPALGIYQMEPSTHDDIIKNYLAYNKDIFDLINEIGYKELDSSIMLYDARYATIFARLHYRRVKEALRVDLDGMAEYWKKYYNTENGSGEKEDFVNNYKRYVN